MFRLALDLISSLPYNQIFESIARMKLGEMDDYDSVIENNFTKTPDIFRILRIIRLLRLLKLIRVFKLGKIIKVIEEYIVSDEVMFVMRFAKIMVTICFFAHWMACFYWAVGMM